MDIKDRLFIIDNIDEYKAVIYDNYTGALYSIPINVAKLLKENIQDNDEVISNIYKKIKGKEPINSYELIKENQLGEVRLLVSNDCNMRCKYCYAHGGSYGQSRGVMDEDMAKTIAQKLSEEFDMIYDINFFGGEPLMNISVIKSFCEEIEIAYKKGKLKRHPKYSLTTNGTIINDTVLETINRFKIKVLVSIDGPGYINDKYRVFENGSGSYKKIEKNIKTLKKYTGEPTCIEATYSMEHYKNDFTYSDIMEFMKENFDINYSFIIPVTLTNEQRKEITDQLELTETIYENINCNQFADSLEQFLENGLIEHRIAKFIAKLKVKHYINHYCQAGISQIAIDINGDIYPCQLFISNETLKANFYMGNLVTDNLIKNEKFISVRNKLKFINKDNNNCIDCPDKLFCSSCIADVFTENGTLNPKSKKHCNNVRKDKENFLVNLSKLYSDKNKWNIFKKRLEEIKYEINRGINIE